MSRSMSLSVVLVALLAPCQVRAESPIISQMATTEVARENALAVAVAARDPLTGNPALESTPMQCAIACQMKVDERMTLCLRKAPEDVLRAAGIEDVRNCVPESAQRYEACLVNCGMPSVRPRAAPARNKSLPARRGPHTSTPPSASTTPGGAP